MNVLTKKLGAGSLAVLLLLTAVFSVFSAFPNKTLAAPTAVPFADRTLSRVECHLKAVYGSLDDYVGDDEFFGGNAELGEFMNAYARTLINIDDVDAYLETPHWYIISAAAGNSSDINCENGHMAIFLQDTSNPGTFRGIQQDVSTASWGQSPYRSSVIELNVTNASNTSSTELVTSISNIHIENGGNPETLSSVNVGISGGTVGNVVGSQSGGGSSGGGSGSGGTPTAQYVWAWRDISTIERRLGVQGAARAVETYTLSSWSGNSHKYYLVQSEIADRQELTSASDWVDPGSGNDRIDCRPFIEFGDGNDELDINFDNADADNFQNLADALNNSSTGKLHDFQKLDGAANRCQDTGDDPDVTPTLNENKKIFFKYYPATNSILALLSADPDSNEGPYVGPYERSGSTNTFNLASSDCTTDPARIEFAGDPPQSGATSAATLKIRNGCTGPTDIALRVLGETATAQPPAGQTDTTGDPDETAIPASCESSIDNGFGWVICPLLDAADEFINTAEGVIRSKLAVNTDFINDVRLRESWLQIARISSGLLVVVGLVMVISTALGSDLFSAYSVKKILPRLVIGAIGIWLSWTIASTYVNIMNDLGRGVAGLLWSPWNGDTITIQEDIGTRSFTIGRFEDFGLKEVVSVSFAGSGTATDLTVTGIFGVSIISFFATSGGIFAILAAAIPVVGAMLIGFILLSLREILIVFLVVIAPIGVAAWILPNTQKGWKLWSGTFNKLLLLFPLFTAVFAAAKIFALIAAEATQTNNGFIEVTIPMIAYVSPFFFIPTLFKAAGGIFSNITGMVNNRGKGIFDRARGGLDNIAKNRKTFRDQLSKEKLARTAAGAGLGAGLARTRMRVQGGQPIAAGNLNLRNRAATKSRVQTTMASLEAKLEKQQIEEAEAALIRNVTLNNDADGLLTVVLNKEASDGERRAALNRLTQLKDTEKLGTARQELGRAGRGDIWDKHIQDKFGDTREFAPHLAGTGIVNTRDPFAGASAEGASKWNQATWEEAFRSNPEAAGRLAAEVMGNDRLRQTVGGSWDGGTTGIPTERDDKGRPKYNGMQDFLGRHQTPGVTSPGSVPTAPTGPAPAAPPAPAPAPTPSFTREQVARMGVDNIGAAVTSRGGYGAMHESDLLSIANEYGGSEAGNAAREELRRRGLLSEPGRDRSIPLP